MIQQLVIDHYSFKKCQDFDAVKLYTRSPEMKEKAHSRV